MKKIFVTAILAVVALGSWAFYPKTAAAPEYMQLSVYGGSGRPVLVIISPRGEVTEETLTTKAKGEYKYQALVLMKLNELRAQGWTVAQMQQTETRNPDPEHPMLSPNVVTTAVYLLERN
ncbi:hypothetical protein [Hymenobacter cellulosilyticus]|uniref:DUF4198 domain-containing protein n=1 Tax=Hymenobacter cellulosilyticus TaxID=2932248 RepID=A0A8T9QA27_9BACT|nr:hypothetical protein [Hymenobacter cellulosilyticus]UOQ72369.1 hypothetical protein MUN79_28160 [Hymenobacter cellulosilyticus]